MKNQCSTFNPLKDEWQIVIYNVYNVDQKGELGFDEGQTDEWTMLVVKLLSQLKRNPQIHPLDGLKCLHSCFHYIIY